MIYQAAEACLFALDVLGWYLLAAQLLEATIFPISLPVGDLSHIILGRTTRSKRKQN
jgi:hypothetical protein